MTEIAEPTEHLSTEEMVALLVEPAAAEFANQVAEAYESVERVYNASLNVAAPCAAATSTNHR